MKHLILVQIKSIYNRFKSFTFIDELKASVFLFVSLIIFGVIYFAAWRLISYLNAVPVIGFLLLNKLLSLVFLTSFLMIILSSIIASFSTIFNSRDLFWLMAAPVSIRQIFVYKSINTVFYASWMVVAALAPVIIAFGQVKHLGFSFYLFVTVLLVPFLLIAGFIGIFAGLLLMRFFPAKRTRDILLVLGVLTISGLYILFRVIEPERLVKPDGLEIISQYLEVLSAPTAVYLPSWWITGGIFSFIAKSKADMIFYAMLLFGSASAGFMLISAAARKFFYKAWAEGKVYHRKTAVQLMVFSKRTPLAALIEKDLKIFFRDTSQWTQLLLLGALAVVYLFSIYKLPLETMYIQNLIAFFNVGLIGFMTAAVALRFVFPSISLEGQSFWLIKSSPVPMKKFIAGKLIFGSIPVMILGIILITASNFLLKVDKPVFLMSLCAAIIMTAGLNSMAIGFGAVFPKFNMLSTAQIESSLGGLFYIFAAFFYLVINISLWALPVQNFYKIKFSMGHTAWQYLWWAAAGLFIINFIAIIMPLWFGLKAVKKLEV